MKMKHQSPQEKHILTQLTRNINQNKIWLRKLTHLLSPQKIILTHSTKHRNQKHPKKHLIPPKEIKMTQLTERINQGIF